jgi:hypothetical protein
LEHLQYPIGKFNYRKDIDSFEADKQVIAKFPNNIKQLLASGLNERLDLAYRPDGWTGRQVVHHCADSHMHAYLRIRLALTEDVPTIKPYDEGAHALLPDYRDDIVDTLNMLEILHKRWVNMLNSLKDTDLERTYIHPASQKVFTLREVCSLYAWHCNHHLGHLKIIEGA